MASRIQTQAGPGGAQVALGVTALVQQWLDRQLGQRSSQSIFWLAFALTAILGGIDFATGAEVSFSIFYLLPVSLAAWYARPAVIPTCLLCAGTWLGMDLAAGGVYSQPWIPVWNTLVRLGFFAIVALLLGNLRGALEAQTELAERDGLTGVLNARTFGRRYEAVARLGRRHRHPLALGYIDLDGFKGVNDSLGHSAGDRVLRAVAERLQRGLRTTDVLARIGGDEFALLLPETDRAGAEVIFPRLHQALLELAVQEGWPIGFSVGVAVFADPPLDADRALHVADDLMYRVKRGVKNDLRIELINDPSLR